MATNVGNSSISTPLMPSSVNSRMIDPSDPLYVSSSDIPGIPLVSTLFNGFGYSGWRRNMLIGLSGRNKIGFINESCPTPESSSSGPNSYSQISGQKSYQQKINFEQKRCRYCKKPGHLIEECLKRKALYGDYKPPQKGRIGAANAIVNSDEFRAGFEPSSSYTSSSHVPGITQEQYNQLMLLLQQSKLSESSSQSGICKFCW